MGNTVLQTVGIGLNDLSVLQEAKSLNMSVWILSSGTASLLDLLCQAPRTAITLNPQPPRDGQDIVGSRIRHSFAAPQGACPTFPESAPVEGLKIIRLIAALIVVGRFHK